MFQGSTCDTGATSRVVILQVSFTANFNQYSASWVRSVTSRLSLGFNRKLNKNENYPSLPSSSSSNSTYIA